jgi:hypothetical protein
MRTRATPASSSRPAAVTVSCCRVSETSVGSSLEETSTGWWPGCSRRRKARGGSAAFGGTSTSCAPLPVGNESSPHAGSRAEPSRSASAARGRITAYVEPHARRSPRIASRASTPQAESGSRRLAPALASTRKWERVPGQSSLPVLVQPGTERHFFRDAWIPRRGSVRAGAVPACPGIQRSAVSGLGCRGSYRASSPPPGSLSVVIRPKPSSLISLVNSTPLPRSSATVACTSSHIR